MNGRRPYLIISVAILLFPIQSIAESVEQDCKQYGGLFNCVQPDETPPNNSSYIYKWEQVWFDYDWEFSSSSEAVERQTWMLDGSDQENGYRGSGVWMSNYGRSKLPFVDYPYDNEADPDRFEKYVGYNYITNESGIKWNKVVF